MHDFSLSLVTLLHLSIVHFFFFTRKIFHSSKCIVPSHWGFNLNFLDDSDVDSNIMSLI